jgi:hypothetical protein
MSHWIQYQSCMFRLGADVLGTTAPRYAYAVEGGSNNLTTRSRDGREWGVRDWYLAALGTEVQVLRQVVRIAADCEGGGVRIQGRRLSPESYIAQARRLLGQACDAFAQHITLAADVPADHPLVQRAKVAQDPAFALYSFTEDRVGRVRLMPVQQTPPHWRAWLELFDPYLDDGSLPIGRLGQVFQLASSYRG